MKKILIVEDDQIVANLYRNKFAVEGYSVEVALDGEQGLETVRAFRPDAVVLDLMLPKMSGVELMKLIRAEPGFHDTPVIVFSNTYLTNMVQEAWKAGATKCLSKANCSPKQVCEAIRSALPANGASSGKDFPTAMMRRASASPAEAPMVETDAKSRKELQDSLVARLPALLAALREELKGVIKADGEVGRLKHLKEMARHLHTAIADAGAAGFLPIVQMCGAFEELLGELYEKPRNINVSTLRTVASAVDFLGILFQKGTTPECPLPGSASILVVDDEPISRRAIGYALEKAKLKCISLEDPLTAYATLLENRFELIFLDVDMPQMTGFELCTKLRTLPEHSKTPVVFVTCLNDLESRTNSTMSGGNDFIAKPFMFIELAVKALVYVLRGRLAAGK